jgi:competence protein ComEC
MKPSPLSWSLAPAGVGAVLSLQLSASLPGSGMRGAVGLLAVLAVLGAWRAWSRAPRIAVVLVVVAWAAAAWSVAAMRAAQRLEERLPASLEGVELAVVGVVDELPVAVHRGVRFGFRVEACVAPESGRPRERPAGPRAEADDDAGEGAPAVPALHGGDAVPTDAGAPCVLPPRIQLSWQSPPRGPGEAPLPVVRAGQRWALRVRLKRPHAPVNPDAFDRELRWLQEGIGAVGRVRSGRLQDEQAGGPAVRVERWRGTLRDAVFDALDPARAREAGVLAALAIGDQAAIDPALWTLFNQTGVGHLMSISGLHITMLAALGAMAAGGLWRWRIAARLGLGCMIPAHRARPCAAVAVAFGYAALAGWGIPAQRTCFMLAVAALLVVTGRAGSIGATLGAAAATIVLIDPWAPLSAGFWLSFGAVVAIVWASDGVRLDRPRLPRWLTGALRTQWAATLALVPLGAWFFGSVSLVGPIANAIAIPLVSIVITPLALAGAAVGALSAPIAAWLLAPAATLLAALVELLSRLAMLPAASLPVPRPGLAVLLATTAGCLLLLAPPGVPRRWLGACALLPLATAPLARPGPGAMWVTALDVGQGTAVVLQVEGRVLVYDTGPPLGPDADAGSRVLVPWLRGRGIGHLDAVVVSHLDADHSGGALSLLRAMPTERLASSLPDGHPIVVAAPKASRCVRGERWRWGRTEFEWLHPADPPERARGSPSNAASCVLRVRGPAGSVLLTGDVESAQERRLVELYGHHGLAADLLVVPHHGSRTSSTEAFVEAVSPRWAIVQAAYRSRFRHPHPAVVERYERRGSELLRSDADGAIQVRLNEGGAPRVIRSRHEPARYWRVPVSTARAPP